MSKRFATVLVAAIIVLALAVAKRHELVRVMIQGAAGLAGYRLRVAEFHIGWRSAEFVGVDAERGREPLLNVGRIVIRYSPRDLLPGSRHRYGLTGIEVDRPRLTLIRFKDGSFNVAIPSGGAPAPAPLRVNPVPIRFGFRVTDARIELREPSAYEASAKRLRVDGIVVDGLIDTAAVTRYTVLGAFEESRREPFTIAGRIDAIAGYAIHHARAAYFPARALANYGADTPAVRVLGGEARNFDAKLYALDVMPNQSPHYHVGMSLDVRDARLAIVALAAPVEHLNAHLGVIDNAVYVRDASAGLAGLPLHIDGGVYDFTGGLTGKAQLRLGVSGTGDLSTLRRAFTFASDQPISGAARLGVLVNGPIDDPVIVAKVTAARARYRDMPFELLKAGVVYHSNVVALAPLRVSYGGIALRLDGTLRIGTHLDSRFAIHVEGPASHLPYLDEMLGDEPIVVDASATGTDLLFHVIGSVASTRGVARVAAIVDTDRNGTAAVEPFWLHTERGDFDGAYVLDRPHSTSAFWMLARNLHMRAAALKSFPGISLPEMPDVNGQVTAVALAGGGAGNDIVLAGRVAVRDASIAGVGFTSLDAAFGGTLQDAAVDVLRATGGWGRFDGHGAFSSRQFAAYGAYRGTFEGLRPLIGDTLEGRGPIAGTVGIAIAPQRIIVQGSHLAMHGASLRGVPIDDASMTLAIAGNRMRVYSANARTAGGDLVAAGTFALAPTAANPRTNALALVANGLHASQLHGIGLPLDGGTLSVTGMLAAGAPLPSFAGGVAISGSRFDRFTMTGNGDVRLAGTDVALQRILGALGGTYANVNGRILDLTSRTPGYAIDAGVPAARIEPALRSFGLPNYMTDGTFNARLHVAGRSATPNVSGSVGVPAGEINGLPFINGTASLAADARGVSIRDASVLIGTTQTHFSAEARPHDTAIALRAPRADLSDFNNFFDTGDTLDGNGTVELAAASRNAQITSSGKIDVRGFRYRNLPIGDTKATWSSARNVVTGALAVGGSEGTLRAKGSIGLQPAAEWQSTLVRSRFDLDGAVDDLDLSLWMPALGMQSVPITGRASGTASVHGRYPNMALKANAAVANGTLGPLTLDRANLSLHSAGRRVVIDRAEIATSTLSATAAGTLGLSPTEPIDVQVHASTDHLAQLVYDVARYRVPVRGSFESTLKIGGTYKSPTFLAGFDASDVVAYGIPIASLFGEVRVARRALVLSDAGATFTHGQATLAGSLPLELAPLRLAAPGEPISFDLDVVGLDPGILDAALGNNSKLTGTIDGHVGLSGTVARPEIVGRVELANGSYVSDLERAPISQIAAAIVFNHSAATLQRASARLGSGTIAASGNVGFANGFSAGGATLAFTANARGAQLDLPAYGNGTLDGRLSLTKKPSADALLAGNATLSNAALSFASFVKAAQGSGSGARPLPLAFDLHATAGKNVRVRGNGYGAGLDIGVTGSIAVAGTLAAPTLAGGFDSTGGTLTYFDRAFRVQKGSVRFNASDGVLPTLSAVATTSVVNPDPDRARNPYGSAEITIRVDGQIPNFKIALTSNPPGYTQDQILGLIAPFGGFINGIGFTQQGVYARQQPNGITPLGTLSPIPNVSLPQRSTITVGQEAFNLLNAQFTAGLLAPVESTLGQGLGLSSINLTLGYYGNVGLTATRLLGKAVSAVYAVTFGIPQIQSFGLSVAPNRDTSANLNFYYQSGPTRLLELPTAPVGYNGGYLANAPLVGNTGFSLTFQRYFW